MNPKFIVFEGIDGCGKGTSIEFAKKMLDERNIPYGCVRDPGKTRIGEKIREILLDPEHEEMSRETELLLYVAARAQLLAECIEPLLNSGKFVLCDRFDLSTLTYQYIFGGWEDEVPIETTTRIFVGQRKSPDHYILLDVPAEIGKKRVGKEQDRQEQKSCEIFERVRQRYLMYAEKWDNITVIDSSGSVDDMLIDVEVELREIFEIGS